MLKLGLDAVGKTFSALAYPDTNWFVARKELKDLLGSVMKTFL